MGVKEIYFHFLLDEKARKDSSTGSEWQEILTLGAFIGRDAETSSAGLNGWRIFNVKLIT